MLTAVATECRGVEVCREITNRSLIRGQQWDSSDLKGKLIVLWNKKLSANQSATIRASDAGALIDRMKANLTGWSVTTRGLRA
jgi:hypothetical protein